MCICLEEHIYAPLRVRLPATGRFSFLQGDDVDKSRTSVGKFRRRGPFA